METEMYISELEQIKKMKFNGTSVMNCPHTMLQEICFSALCRIDDYQQAFPDEEFFVEAYNEVENLFLHLKYNGLVSINTRNELRILLKHTEKSAASLLFN